MAVWEVTQVVRRRQVGRGDRGGVTAVILRGGGRRVWLHGVAVPVLGGDAAIWRARGQGVSRLWKCA